MTLKELLDTANEGYPDGFLEMYYNEDGTRSEGGGDGLAGFIVTELSETFDAKASTKEQLDDAISKLETAQDDLAATICALEKRAKGE